MYKIEKWSEKKKEQRVHRIKMRCFNRTEPPETSFYQRVEDTTMAHSFV